MQMFGKHRLVEAPISDIGGKLGEGMTLVCLDIRASPKQRNRALYTISRLCPVPAKLF